MDNYGVAGGKPSPGGKGAKWGIYTIEGADAMQMAWDLEGALPPILHANRPGEHDHYHVNGFDLFGVYKHFHVWYGAVNGG